MKVRRHLTYANVMSTIAVFGVLAGGSAYAVGTIGSKDIKPNAVTGKHIRNSTVRGMDVNERTLNARGFSQISGEHSPECDPSDAEFVDCASVALNLRRSGRAFVVATGANYSVGSPASGNCQIQLNGSAAATNQIPGEDAEVNTSAGATNGFARTYVTPQLPAGSVEIALACNQPGAADFRVASPTIAAIALTNGRR